MRPNWLTKLLTAACVAGAFVAAPASAKNLKFAYALSTSSHYGAGADAFVKTLEAELPGKFKVEQFPNSALGGEREVPTRDGRVKLKIPEGTQTGKLFRLRGKGVTPVRGGGVGDLICRVVVETPVKLNKRQRELLEELRESLHGDQAHSPRASGWFDGMKRFFGDGK